MESSSSSAAAPPSSRPWVALGRVTLVQHDSDEDRRSLSVALAAPPGASILTVPATVHPDRDNPDGHPYVVAADGDAGLLLHVSASPSVGFNLDRWPQGVLLVARRFLPVDAAAGHGAPTAIATAVTRLPDRYHYKQSDISHLGNLGLVSRPASAADSEYMVAELRVGDRKHRQPNSLLTFCPGSDAWVERSVSRLSISANRLRKWSSHDVIPHDGKLWWVDLVWGLLGCDPSADPVALSYVDLPASEITDHYRRDVPPRFIEGHRMVGVSQGKLRFVDVFNAPVHNLQGDTRVAIWTLVFHASGETSWETHREANLTRIWNTAAEKPAWAMEVVPAFALLHPSDPDVVFFFLAQHLLSVNVNEGRILEFVDEKCHLVEAVVPGSAGKTQINWRHVLAWVLPAPLDNKGKTLWMLPCSIPAYPESCSASDSVSLSDCCICDLVVPPLES